MSPLQRIGLGLVIVALFAPFPQLIGVHPHPAWNYYDALPPPIGWLFILSAIAQMRRTTDLDLRYARMAAVIAAVVSVPLWFPQINHYLAPQYNTGVNESWQWLVALPTWVFGYFFCRAVTEVASRQAPPERRVAGWFGVLQWGFVVAAALPAVVYGGGVKNIANSMSIAISIAEVGLIVMAFNYHRRAWLGGPGPKIWATPAPRSMESAQPHLNAAVEGLEWEEFKAGRERAREEIRERRRARRLERNNAKRPE